MEKKILDRATVIQKSRNYFFSQRDHEFKDFLGGSEAESLGALLYAYGFPYVAYSRDDSIITLFAGYDLNALEPKLTYEISSQSIGGEMASNMNKMFKVIDAIENKLDSVVLLPPEMRKRRIETFIKILEVDHELFNTALRNWG